MESGDSSSSDSSPSPPKPRPVGGASRDEAVGVYLPPHFPQRGAVGGASGSDFSPESEESSEEEEDPSSGEEVRGHTSAPPIRTYAPPTTFRLNDTSENDTGSGMESGQTSRHGSVPFQPVPVRRRPVNYRQFYGSRVSSEGSDSGEVVSWGRRGRRKVGFNPAVFYTLISLSLSAECQQ